MKRLRLISVLIGSVIGLWTLQVHASPITYDFTVTGTSGPLNGTVATGRMTFDSSIIPSGGGRVTGQDSLTYLDFTWHGIHYDASTANTGTIGAGGLEFDSAGDLINSFFGTIHGDQPGAGSSVDSWYTDHGNFCYGYWSGTPGYWDQLYFGNVSFSIDNSVPEPASLSVLGMSVFGLLARRRRHA